MENSGKLKGGKDGRLEDRGRQGEAGGREWRTV